MVGLVQGPPPLTLEKALDIARHNRPTVQAAELRVEQARRQRSALLAPLPTRLDFQTTTNRDLYGNDDDIVLAQPIDLFGKRGANRSLGDAQVQLAQANLRQVLLDVQADVVERYADAAAAAQLVQTANAQLEVSERLVDATRRRAEGGAVPPVQVRRAALEVERARQNLKLRESSLLAAKKRLGGALGTSQDKIESGDFAEVQTAPIDTQTLSRQRADLLQLSSQVAIAQANVAVTRVQFRPEFELSARTSPYSYGPNQPAGLRATLSIPLFDHGRSRNEVGAAQSEAEAERKALTDATDRALAELDAVNIELAAAVEQRESFERIIADSRELVRIAEVGYQEGATALLEVLEATRSLREAEESLVEAKLRVAQAQSAYLRATGTLLGGEGR